MTNREFITDPLTALTYISKHEVSLVRNGAIGGVNWVQRTRWLAVSPRLMRHLIGAGLVEKPNLRWSTGSWCYRLTDLGEILVFNSATATMGQASAQAPVQPHGQEDQNDRTPEPNPNQGSDPS